MAPGSRPRRPGDRIQTDRRDAENWAEYFAAGRWTECFGPDPDGESARGRVRSRADRHRPQVRAFSWLRSRGPTYDGGQPWTRKFMTGLSGGPVDAGKRWARAAEALGSP